MRYDPTPGTQGNPLTMIPFRLAGMALLGLALAAPALPSSPRLSTVAERSGFLQTGRFDEVQTLCTDFQQRYPDRVRCQQFGLTPEGRPMLVLIANDRGALTPDAARKLGLPVLLLQGGIHAGEIDGKDAGFLALRQMLEAEAAPNALEHQVVLFVPVFNVDGHERFGAWNRPNQRGPEQMGWRTTSQNFNLNRDYAKAESPEMQAMLALVEAWDPLLVADLHVTDGAQFEHDISIQVEPLHSGDMALRPIGKAIRDAVIQRLEAQGSLPLPFYPSFEVNDDPASGFADGVASPRFSTGYFQLRNRFAMLVETHSWRRYPERVRSTRHTIVALAELVARHGRAWRQAALDSDQRALSLGGQDEPLAYLASAKVRTLAFRGYAYTRTPSEVSGALMTRYDESTPQVWNIPMRDDVRPSLVVAAPRGGYLVPAAQSDVVARVLQHHGISFQRLPDALPEREVEAFRADSVSFSTSTLEGHHRLTLAGAWAAESHALPPGSLFVPIAQAKSRLVMALLEPQAPDSLASWGAFNNAFEQKEYMEDYVAEQVAREKLAADPALKAEFERKLAEDPAFAASPSARLQFFHQRHASWDARLNLYPVLRTGQALR